ncbi:hypothetical protein ACFDTO_32375 [Microbacteriaceae bacterium 4G12]
MKKTLAISAILVVSLLSGCGKGTLEGKWALSPNSQRECPVQYEFKQVKEKIKNTDKTKIVNVVTMHTENVSKPYEYTGPYNLLNKKTQEYKIDYGNSFINKQRIIQRKDTLQMVFEGGDKMCTYKKR